MPTTLFPPPPKRRRVKRRARALVLFKPPMATTGTGLWLASKQNLITPNAGVSGWLWLANAWPNKTKSTPASFARIRPARPCALALKINPFLSAPLCRPAPGQILCMARRFISASFICAPSAPNAWANLTGPAINTLRPSLCALGIILPANDFSFLSDFERNKTNAPRGNCFNNGAGSARRTSSLTSINMGKFLPFVRGVTAWYPSLL